MAGIAGIGAQRMGSWFSSHAESIMATGADSEYFGVIDHPNGRECRGGVAFLAEIRCHDVVNRFTLCRDIRITMAIGAGAHRLCVIHCRNAGPGRWRNRVAFLTEFACFDVASRFTGDNRVVVTVQAGLGTDVGVAEGTGET